jgi:transposase
VYTDMEQWAEIRRRVLVEQVSQRQILRETGMHWKTLQKILAHSEPPGYRRDVPFSKPKIGPFLDRIRQILEDDRRVPKKQRHTAKRLFERIQQEGYTGGYTQVKDAVREIKQTSQEVFVPLIHRPGEAQVDFGFALVNVAGQLRKLPFFVMTLPYSGALFVQVYERMSTEIYWDAHRRAFEFFDGVPVRITYDNDRTLAAEILGAHERKLTDGFLQLKSHYLFDTHFCQVWRANEKGVVESMVKYSRLNFMVPVPQVRDLEKLNSRLLEQCVEDRKRRLRGQKATKEVLLPEDQAAFLSLPAAPFDACRKVSTTANSEALVRFDRNDYSVPVRYAHHPVVVKGYVDRVVICDRQERIATHRRLWGTEDVCFEPLHYLALLERKPGALDHARPLENWKLPDGFAVLRRRLEDERGGEGTREFIRVLRLLEKHALSSLTRAVTKGLRVGALTRDAIAQFLIPQEEWRQTMFRLDGREHLRQVKVTQTDVVSYSELLVSGGVR